jgi:hypothetical protein
MKNLHRFQEFIGEGYGDPKTLTASKVAEYISDITPEESDVPDFFISQIKKSGKIFHLKRLNIEDLLKNDSSLKEYVDSKELRYDDEESDHVPDPDDLEYPIVVFNGEVVDGYNRTSVHYHSGDKFIDAYVSQ